MCSGGRPLYNTGDSVRLVVCVVDGFAATTEGGRGVVNWEVSSESCRAMRTLAMHVGGST